MFDKKNMHTFFAEFTTKSVIQNVFIEPVHTSVGMDTRYCAV